MMATAAEIEPAEISYFADGEFRASRDIFGPLSDEESPVRTTLPLCLSLSSTPCFSAISSRPSDHPSLANSLQVKEPTPKRQRRARKPTFSDISVNAHRARPSRSKKAAGKSPEKRRAPMIIAPSAPLFTKPVPTLNPLALTQSFGQSYAPTAEEEEEFKMTVGEIKKKKRTFGVFQDVGESPSGMLATTGPSLRPSTKSSSSNREFFGGSSVCTPSPVIDSPLLTFDL